MEIDHEMSLGNQEFSSDFSLFTHPNIFIGDTGASVTSSKCKVGSKNAQQPSSTQTLGIHGEGSQSKSVIDILDTWCYCKDNEYLNSTLKDVQHNPTHSFNLFSPTKAMQNDEKLTGDKNYGLQLSKCGHTVKFDIKVKSRCGVIYAGHFKQDQEVSALSTDIGTAMSIVKALKLLEHYDKSENQATAKVLDWNITKGALPPCESCAVSKAEQKAL